MLYFYERVYNSSRYHCVLRTAPPEKGVSAMWTSEGCHVFPIELVRFMLENCENDAFQKVNFDIHGWRVLTEKDFHAIVNFLGTIGLDFTIQNDVGRGDK